MSQVGTCQGFKFVNAAEILRHSGYDDWAAEDITRCEESLRNVWHKAQSGYALFANGGWDTGTMQTVMTIGIFCDDRVMFEDAVRYAAAGPETAPSRPDGQLHRAGPGDVRQRCGRVQVGASGLEPLAPGCGCRPVSWRTHCLRSRRSAKIIPARKSRYSRSAGNGGGRPRCRRSGSRRAGDRSWRPMPGTGVCPVR
jgi:hypothetical protein